MKTEISFTFQTQTGFEESYEHIKNLTEYAVKEILSNKYWWGIEYIGCKIIAVDLKNASDEVKSYYKPRRQWFKQKYIANNPLYGDRNYHGFAVFEYGLSQKTYHALVTESPRINELLREDFRTMIDKMKYLEKKVPDFNFADFKRVFLEAIYSKTK